MARYVTPKEAAKTLGVSVSSLRRWESEGRIKAIRTPGGQRRYVLEEIEEAAGISRSAIIVLYARVSTHSQQDDLERQLEYLRSKFPEGECISEVGSGLNFRRRKFLSILDRILTGDIDKLVIAHPDRFVRFGFDLVKWLCERHECELVVLNQTKLSTEQELVQDMLSIVHCFSARLYGLRKYKKQVQQALQEDFPSCSHKKIDKEVAQQCQENPGVS
ncbi:MAG: IS607 family transposase [Limnoraphis sp. WC205]|jgi:excisionase family DNA binding protein|nr:IS607 family transposase [Limnoraphis sp. WC205]